jgi:hypothetical protein
MTAIGGGVDAHSYWARTVPSAPPYGFRPGGQSLRLVSY